jgi:trimethylamine:corrinoid methyltransferase-like protein
MCREQASLGYVVGAYELSDKPFMGSVTEPSRAQDSVEMCEILFGKDFLEKTRHDIADQRQLSV